LKSFTLLIAVKKQELVIQVETSSMFRHENNIDSNKIAIEKAYSEQ
jgi:hypothetical protein